MKERNLTQLCAAARNTDLLYEGRTMDWKWCWTWLSCLSFLGTASCINVAAPDEPIVIELNVNIEARLLVELAEDANDAIDENADIF